MPRVAVIGAGAAGTVAAIFAAQSGADTTLIEGTRDGGRKILISGGGRCNILPAVVDESRFVTDSSPNTLKKIVRSWPLREQIAFFEHDAGIPLVEERQTSKLFPASQSARDVRDRLYLLATGSGVTFTRNTIVTAVTSVPESKIGWRVDVRNGSPLIVDAVVLATGGLSVPATGSDGFGLTMAKAVGHTVLETYPALTPLTGSPPELSALAGVSLSVSIKARSTRHAASSSGGFLFTHAGYSGPSVLDVSHVAVRSRMDDEPARIIVRWTVHGDDEWNRLLEPAGPRTVLTAVAAELPGRLAETLIRVAGIDPRLTLANLSRREKARLIDALVRTNLSSTGDEGYRKAEVTGGGVNLAEIDPRTMESRKAPGLFLCGELLDAFGPIGGYNFLWAWATGRAAGFGAARRLL